GQSRIGLVAREHQVDGLTRGLERRVLQRSLRKYGGETCRNEQHVALAQGHVELLGQMQHHVARGQRPAGLQEAQMARGDVRLAGEVELAHAPALPPLAQEISYRLRCHRYASTLARDPRALPLPAR